MIRGRRGRGRMVVGFTTTYVLYKGATLSCKDDSGRIPLEHAMMTYRTFSTFILLNYGERISGYIWINFHGVFGIP